MRMLDLFAGELGWASVFAARGWKVTAVDLNTPRREIPAGCTFIQRNILRITPDWVKGMGFDFACASSPCEKFSVFGMPHFFPHPEYPEEGIELFNHTRWMLEESGIPYVMENVRAAQKFVGKAVHHCGPFYLWGNAVPPLMPQGIIKGMGLHMAIDKVTGKRILAGGRKFSSKSKQRAECTAKLATIPPELANAVAEYAERLIRAEGKRMTESPYAMPQAEEMVSLHAISCGCERSEQVRALERERNRPSPYFSSPKKEKRET